MPSNVILILISAVPVYLMWAAIRRIPAARTAPVRMNDRRPRTY